MGNRLSKITTRTGDTGQTGLADGSRISKSAPLIAALGDVDELNSSLGLLLCESLPEIVRAQLVHIQYDLFDMGAALSLPGYAAVTELHLTTLEEWLEAWNATLPPLKEFILPAGTRPACLTHMARCICRRAERQFVVLLNTSQIKVILLQYLNRLSDYLFILSRVLNRQNAGSEVYWQTREPIKSQTHSNQPKN